MCVITRYYGISPGEMENMDVNTFRLYLRNIPEVEQLFTRGADDRETEDKTSRETLSKILSRKGVKIPE